MSIFWKLLAAASELVVWPLLAVYYAAGAQVSCFVVFILCSRVCLSVFGKA